MNKLSCNDFTAKQQAAYRRQFTNDFTASNNRTPLSIEYYSPTLLRGEQITRETHANISDVVLHKTGLTGSLQSSHSS